MNKRIKELLEQATSSRTLSGGVEYDVRVDQEMFAELILEECLNIVGHYADVDEGIAVAKKNFGVE